MKIPVAILGATGAVGQRFVSLLAEHPWFELVGLCASSRSAGKKYSKLGKWILDEEMPAVTEQRVIECSVSEVKETGAKVVFSALPADVAGLEREFAKDFAVCSNVSVNRMQPDVPLVIPEVNPDHLGIIPYQREKNCWNGFIVTNPNCSTIGLTLPLKPLQEFGLKTVTVTTMQALSGAGYPGVPSVAIIDNVLPFIEGEENKIQTEPLKLLGSLENDKFKYADFKISASCNRVAVKDGHLESVFVCLENRTELEEIKNTFKNFKSVPQELKLPSAPERPIILRDEEDRPQPKKDRNAGRGMAVSVGRVRKDDLYDVKFSVLSHNTIRGAAGASVLNAELLKVKGYIS